MPFWRTVIFESVSSFWPSFQYAMPSWCLSLCVSTAASSRWYVQSSFPHWDSTSFELKMGNLLVSGGPTTVLPWPAVGMVKHRCQGTDRGQCCQDIGTAISIKPPVSGCSFSGCFRLLSRLNACLAGKPECAPSFEHGRQGNVFGGAQL